MPFRRMKPTFKKAPSVSHDGGVKPSRWNPRSLAKMAMTFVKRALQFRPSPNCRRTFGNRIPA